MTPHRIRSNRLGLIVGIHSQVNPHVLHGHDDDGGPKCFLTHKTLIKQPDWDEWLTSEYVQLDPFDAQGMFGDP